MNNKTSFGTYFDDQRDRIVNNMQTGKNAELNIAWREDYDKRQREKKERKRTRLPIFSRRFGFSRWSP